MHHDKAVVKNPSVRKRIILQELNKAKPRRSTDTAASQIDEAASDINNTVATEQMNQV